MCQGGNNECSEGSVTLNTAGWVSASSTAPRAHSHVARPSCAHAQHVNQPLAQRASGQQQVCKALWRADGEGAAAARCTPCGVPT